ncbi:MAG: FAD:protein FMN transferase [Magnetococcales bacterium]|nr:FAD:protein FMN transferase [Magnetococcales bacterium]
MLMGTLVSISTWGVGETVGARAVGLAFDEMARIEALMSRMRPQSVVAQLNRGKRGEERVVPAELGGLLEQGLELGRRSGGAFDIGLAPLSDLWGFSLDPPPTAPPPADALAGWLEERGSMSGSGIDIGPAPDNRLRLANGSVGLDLGGIAKGHAVDRAMEVLRREGVENALINAGGDMLVAGSKGGTPWHVGLRDPRDQSGVVAVLELAGRVALSTSGDYERFFMLDGVRYHHILDPRTGHPARSGLVSVSIQAPDSTIADGLSTAVFVLGETAGLALLRHHPGCEALLIREDGGHVRTGGFQGRWVKKP